MNAQAWRNGTPAAEDDVWFRGLHYGDGFFTTVRLKDGRLLNWTAHRHRLQRSAVCMGFPEASVEAVEGDLRNLFPQLAQQDGVMKILLFRGAMQARGYRPSDNDPVERLVLLAEYPSQAEQAPLTLGLSPVQWPMPDVYPGIKHLNRLVQVEASRRLPAGVHEALLCNSRHEAISGIASALVAKLGRTLYFPDLREAGIESTTVQALRQCAQRDGYMLQTTPLPRVQLARMEGLALLNAVRGLQPVAAIEDGLALSFDATCWTPLQQALVQQIEDESWGGE